jgi:Ca2+-transporting ATPase
MKSEKYVKIILMNKLQGLSTSEVLKRKDIYGQNIILDSFILEIKNPINILLILASFISLYLGEDLEGYIILIVVFLNILFSIYQVYKADNAIKSLKSLIDNTSSVVRDGKNIIINSEDLVPGDIIFLEAGSRIPADAKILQTNYAEVNESILTGESLPVLKNISESDLGHVYAGTSVLVGEIYAEVIHTGSNSMFGKIAKSIDSLDDSETVLQKKVKKLTKFIGLLGIFSSAIVFFFLLFKKESLFDSFLYTLSLAVAVVPEGLPAVMTAILSIGVAIMSKKGVVVRRLDAIESLGEVDIIATDKTGTLTKNDMTVSSLHTHKDKTLSFKTEHLMTISGLINTGVKKVENLKNEYSYTGDPTEIGIYKFSLERELTDVDLNDYVVFDSESFSSEKKMRSVSFTHNKIDYKIISGSSENILAMCEFNTLADLDIVKKDLNKEAGKGYRVISLAISKEDDVFNYLGFFALKDPLRDGISNSIKDTREMGIRTIMMTGDSQMTGESIAIEAGIIEKGDFSLSGKDISEMSDEDLSIKLETVSVFARVSPTDKLRIVTLLQSKGYKVLVTGDGVNDAPSLKKADVGVAMGKVGSDVSKQAADAVILDDNFTTIVEGIKEGRAIVRRIQLAMTFFIAGNLGEFIYIVGSLFLGLPTLSPLQILFINLITDAIPALSLAYIPINYLSKKTKENLIKREDIHFVIYSSLFLGVSSLFISYLFSDNKALAVSLVFLNIIIVQQIMLIDIFNSYTKRLKDLLNVFKKSIFFSLIFVIATVSAITLIERINIFDINVNFSYIITIVTIYFLLYIFLFKMRSFLKNRLM